MRATDPRRLLLELYEAALARVEGRTAVARALAGRRLATPRIVAIGKAAAAMALGALDAVGTDHDGVLVITKHGYDAPPLRGRATVIEAGHPTPDGASLAAGEALLRFIDAAPRDRGFLFLLSGGASALVEALPEGVSLEDLARANRWLLGAGLDIAQMNRVRKGLSLIKGGRLAQRLAGRSTLALVISDVPGDDLAVIGSGPLVADRSAAPLPELPAWLAHTLGRATPPPPPEDPCFAAIATEVIAGNRDARAAIVEAAQARGLTVYHHDHLLVGDVADAARAVAATLTAGAAGIHLWGGETTLRLPPEPGRGGRCQQLALSVATQIAGRADLCVLAAATDGSDGPTEDAGALVDGNTVARGSAELFDARQALAHADAGSFLEASGDLIATGPTGTNVMDLVIAFKHSSV